jgi:hypothetical protein
MENKKKDFKIEQSVEKIEKYLSSISGLED